jgi:hypothetical protein
MQQCRTRTVIAYLGDETWQTAVNGKAFGVLRCSGGEVPNPCINHAVVPPEVANQPTRIELSIDIYIIHP